MPIFSSFIILIALLLIELLYFKVADFFNIIDKPNDRSSHTTITLRGGGILYTVSVMLFYCLHEFQYPLFTIGLLLISIISFMDDVLTLNNKVRLCVHLIAVVLLIGQWGLALVPIYLFPIAIILIIGTINAYNFMDGINGITGVYSLVLVSTLYYIDRFLYSIASQQLFIFVGLSLLVFLVFNFRKRAKCFAGDVGSVSIAFILIYLLGELILQTGNFTYILLLLVYGLDTVVTIIFRLSRRENIFQAHRSHFYQFLANEKKISHLYIAAGYGVVQLAINSLVVYFKPNGVSTVIVIILSALLFVGIRFLMEGKKRLWGR